MLDYLIKENGLEAEFDKYGLNGDDIKFIKELINPEEPTNGDWLYEGREKEKSFLYDVIIYLFCI